MKLAARGIDDGSATVRKHRLDRWMDAATSFRYLACLKGQCQGIVARSGRNRGNTQPERGITRGGAVG